MEVARAAIEGDRRELQRRRLLVRGVVQGVGFRPHVYRLASRYGLVGFVRNTSAGALVEVQGTAESIDRFIEALPSEGPPLMRISSLDSQTTALQREKTFSILPSELSEEAFAGVPADIAVCDACLSEVENELDRRYHYPFTNCTNCGPRYSIIREIPYDRAQTTMADFTMCDQCRSEYEDPSNRRFHAQPNACTLCGPRLWLTDSCGRLIPDQASQHALQAAVDLIRVGGIVAWKGLGGYQLICDARQVEAVCELRRRKHRNEKAFAVMVRDVAMAQDLCEISVEEQVLLSGAQKPVVLLRKKDGCSVADNVAPGSRELGIMLPYTPMHELLFRLLEEKLNHRAVLVMTSGNISDEPIVIHNEEAQLKLRTVADVFVHHNRTIHTRVDDSVVRCVTGIETVLRRARGYTPSALPVACSATPILACGAQQKSTICLTKDGSAMLSQHLGDLENYETLQFYQETLDRMQRLFNIIPGVVAHDLHPGYMSTQFALALPVKRHIGIQHHHAHIASCMAEHGLSGEVLGIAWDGTGYGLDGTIWGGEFLVTGLTRFTRFGHFRHIALPGGDSAVREPWRVARSYLTDAFRDGPLPELSLQDSVPERSLRTVDVMLAKRIQTIETSSCGRLFDAVATMAGLGSVVSFEGQAAMALEAIAGDAGEAYDFAIDALVPLQVDMRPMVRQIVRDRERGVAASCISARFHDTLVAIAVEICRRMRSATGLSRVCLGGGCFQNVRLLQGCVESLRAEGFDVFFPQQVPANDGGIAFGQAAIAAATLREGL